MKKILSLIALVGLLIPIIASAYTVQSGDTLWRIAKSHNTTISQLVEDNGIKNPNLIYPGQELVMGGVLGATTKIKLTDPNSVTPAATTTPSAGVIPLTNASGTIPYSFIDHKFGGTGLDGDLIITSGTTTIDLGNANVVVKNYENLSITGSGVLNFSNANANGTYVIIKVKNNATISGVIDFTNTGATGASAVACTSGSSQNGSAGTSGYAPLFTINGGVGSTHAVPALGAGGAVGTPKAYQFLTQELFRNFHSYVGAGGGGGFCSASDVGTGGAGGRGSGYLRIEVGGYYDFTGSILANGSNGGNGSGCNNNCRAGGGGGGGGGNVDIYYNYLTANSGTINVAGGTGGNTDATGTGTSANTCGGGGGATLFTAGSNGVCQGGDNLKTGGDGAVGTSSTYQNTSIF